MPDPTFLNRVRIKNYRSIGACDLTLGPLTFLVGPNGSGKSNFLDALRFAADSLRDSLDHAIRERGGIGEVRRRSTGHPNNFSMRLDFSFESVAGHYSFHVGSKPSGGYEVLNEECAVSGAHSAFYHVRKGR
jgi:predicted ATPase